MTRPLDDHDARHLDRRGVKLLSVAGGVAIGVLLVALGTSGPDSTAEREWIEHSTPRAVPAPEAVAQHPAALDKGVDWNRVEAPDGHGPAAVAAYEQ